MSWMRLITWDSSWVPPDQSEAARDSSQLFACDFVGFDIHATSEFLIAESDMVVSRDTYRLKHRGEFQGIPPKGKELTVTGTDIYRIVDGKIVEEWFEADLGWVQQLR